MEIPITALALLKFPLIFSQASFFGKGYTNLSLWAATMTSTPISYLLHLGDFIGPLSDEKFKALPQSRFSRIQKEDMIEKNLSILKKHYQLMKLNDFYQHKIDKYLK